MDIGPLLSALNKEMQANALFPSGLGPNRLATAGATLSPSGATDAAAAAAAALAAARAAASTGSAASPNAAALAAARANAAVAQALGSGSGAGSGPGGAGLGGAGGTGPSTSGPGSTGGAGAAGVNSVGGAGLSGAGPGGVGLNSSNAAAAAAAEALADVYHSSGGSHPSPSLLAQSGVKAYTQLLNALSEAGHSEQSAEALTNTLLVTSATLKSVYEQALAKLPAALQNKDWRFSVANGALVFAAAKDDLSSQELTLLRAAFQESDVEPFANEVAHAITTMDSKRSVGADMNSLAWGRFRVGDNNFEQVVDLRSYLTSTAPGSKYSANAVGPDGTLHPEVPLTLGGMYLGDLVTARSDFFRPEIPARTDALDRAAETFANAEVGTILHGRCSCGEVSFTLENTLDYAFYCHCSRCRARTGSAFAAIGGASIDKLQVTAGNKHLLIEGECSDGYGARCSRCFAFLFAAVRGRQYVHVSLGVVAGTPSRLPDHHIYVASKAPWFQITDGLPQYDELPLPGR